MKPKLEIITLDDVRSWRPCDPVESFTFVPPDWKGTVFDILDCEQLSASDRIWLVLRDEVMELRDIQMFAFRCAKRVEHLMQYQRSKDALVILERFLGGKATHKELESARIAATAAVGATSWAVARAASMAAIMAVDMALTKYATIFTAKYAAMYAAEAAVEATESAAQIQLLKEILTDGN